MPECKYLEQFVRTTYTFVSSNPSYKSQYNLSEMEKFEQLSFMKLKEARLATINEKLNLKSAFANP